MPVGHFHDAHNLLDIRIRNRFVEKIAHRIHENRFLRAPLEWLRQLLGHESQIEALFVRMAWDPSKAFGESFGVAVFAAGADLRAASHRIPGRVGPFNRRVLRHHRSLRYLLKMSRTILPPVSFGEAKYR